MDPETSDTWMNPFSSKSGLFSGTVVLICSAGMHTWNGAKPMDPNEVPTRDTGSHRKNLPPTDSTAGRRYGWADIL